MIRKEFSRKTKLAAWDIALGCCEDCGLKIRPGDGPEYDHRIPCELGGGNGPENCSVLCIPCHKFKTQKSDVPAITKSRSVRAGNVNAKTVRNKIPGSKGTGLRKKIDGTVVRVNE